MQQFTPKTIATPQFKEIISTLEDAKSKSKASMIIAATGVGKTFAIDTFCAKNNKHTYRITVNDLYRKEDIIDELCILLGLEFPGQSQTWKAHNTVHRLNSICDALVRLHNDGHKPIVIFDEAENMKITPFKMIKAMYDKMKDKCSLVLIGTDQLINNMYINKGRRNRHSIPQLYRRFKAGLKYLTPIDKQTDYEPFFKHYDVPKGLQSLLISLSDNYGDFCDYLYPTIMEAQQLHKPLTEEFFRIKFNIAKTSKPAS